MSNHFIHYIQRKVYIRKPANGIEWYATPQKLGAGFEKPAFHISQRKTGAIQQIQEGDTIWLISELKSPWGKLPPSVDAKIVVQQVCPYKNGQKKFIADPTSSEWFQLANCSRILSKLETENRRTERHPLIHESEDSIKQVGLFLQSIRRLHSAKELIEWINSIQRKPLQFISYRIKDGTKCGFEKTKELLEANEVVFWDRWSLPRRLAERREKTSSTALNNRLMKILRNSHTVWGIESNLYAQKRSYSEKECLIAKQLGIYKSVICQKEEP